MSYQFQNVPPADLISPCEVFFTNEFNGEADSRNAICELNGRVTVNTSDVTIYLTYDGTDTGSSIFSGVPFAQVTAQLEDPDGSAAPYAFIKEINNTELVVGIINVSPFPAPVDTDIIISFFVKGDKAS